MFLKKYGFLIFVIVVAGYFIGKYLYMKPKFINGEVTPDFKTTLISGEAFSFSQLKGNFVLLDFWGTWCGPCLKEMPDLISFHKKFKNQRFKDGSGFQIVSIALENGTRTKRLEAAIERFGLSWKYHINDPINSNMFDAAIATKLFGVREIPTKYLISPDGYIIGVNLSYEEMTNILEKEL